MRSAINLCLLALLATSLAAAQTPAPALTCTRATVPATPADIALLSGDAKEAEALFSAQLATASTSPNYAGLVHAQIDQDKLPEAIASGLRAVSALPGSADAQATLGDAYLRAGRIEAASAAYTNALQLDRCSAHAHFGNANLQQLAAHTQAAQKEFNFAHRLAPGDFLITAAFIEHLPPAIRSAPLKALLAQHPALPPQLLDQLEIDAAELDQNLTCTAEPFAKTALTLQPILQDGRYRRSWGMKVGFGEGPIRLLELDTSVDGIILSASDAAKADVRPLTTLPKSVAATYKAVADEVHVGPLIYRHCLITVVPNSAVDNRNSLIGTNFFRDRLIHIDYVATSVTLYPLPEGAIQPGILPQVDPSMQKDWTPVYVAGPHILVPTLINKAGPFLFALDTGTSATILSPEITKTELKSTADATINLQGSSADFVKVIPRDGGGATDFSDVHDRLGTNLKVSRPVKLPVYRFAGTEIPDDSAVSFDFSSLSHADGVEISGLLGFHLLSYYSLDLDYRDGLARILFDVNRRYHVQQYDLTK